MLARRTRYSLTILTLLIAIALAGAHVLTAQDATPTPDPNCTPEKIKQQQEGFAAAMALDFDSSPTLSLDNMFKLGALYQQLAVRCGYAPTDDEINNQIGMTYAVTDLETIIAYRAVGTDVDHIVDVLKDVTGDPIEGQLLYNGLEPVLDGDTLSCSVCHQGATAPDVVGTYTRVSEVRLKEREFKDYTPEKYLIESIVDPAAYSVPGFSAGLMPEQFGKRLDKQMLADILAYLDSQDQELPAGE